MDALVATVLLGLSLAVILGLVSRAVRAQAQGEKLEVAAMLLDEQLQLVVARGPDNYGQRYGLEGRCDAPYGDYGYRLDVSGGSAGEAYTVTATVTWTEDGRARSESVRTRVAPRRGEDADPDRRPPEPVDRDEA